MSEAAFVSTDALPADPADLAPMAPLRSVGPEDVLLDILMADVDTALEGVDYAEIKAGFLPTSDFSCEEHREERLAVRAIARHPAGGKRIL